MIGSGGVQVFVSQRFRIISKKAFSLHMAKTADAFRAKLAADPLLRPRATGRLR